MLIHFKTIVFMLNIYFYFLNAYTGGSQIFTITELLEKSSINLNISIIYCNTNKYFK